MTNCIKMVFWHCTLCSRIIKLSCILRLWRVLSNEIRLSHTRIRLVTILRKHQPDMTISSSSLLYWYQVMAAIDKDVWIGIVGIFWNIKNHVRLFHPHHCVAIILLSSDGRHRQGWARQKVLASHQIWTWGSLPYIHCSLHYHCLCVHSHHEHHFNGSFSSIS